MEQTADEFFKQFLTSPNIIDLTPNFNQLSVMREKIEFWLKNEHFQLNIQQLIDQMKAKECVEGKNADIAKAFRLEGNKLFKDKNYEDAVNFYTKAAIFAPVSSSELGMAHANRSACFYYLDCFEQCLKDIEFALKNQYSTPVKLFIRKSRALHSMGNNIEARKLLETSLKTHSTEQNTSDEIKLLLKSIPNKNQEEKIKQYEKQSIIFWQLETKSPILSGASGSVEIKVDEIKGRKLVAKQKIQADEVVLIAEPFASILRSSQQNQKCPAKCEACYQSLNLLSNPPFACRNCTHVVYCSFKCEEKAWEKYHYLECGILRTGMKWCGNDSLAARVVLTANISTAINEYKNINQTEPQQNNVTNDYKTLLSLMDHFHDFDTETLLLKTLKAAFLATLITQQDNNIQDFTPDNLFTLGEILLKHILQIRINGMFVTAQSEEEKKVLLALKANADDIYGELVSDEENVALGLYPELSLLNHSCDPNLYQRNGIKTVTQALRDIEIGEELTITYGPIARAVPKAERHQQLQERYFFTCQCIACSDDQYETATAFKCPSCQGAVMYNSINKSNQCLKCKKINPLCLDKTFKLRDFGRQAVIEALTLSSKGGEDNVENVISKLKGAYEILTHILYEHNRELGIIATEITVCCTKFSRFEEAEKYARISGEISKKLYGEDSYQFAVEMMRLTDLQRMRIEIEFPISALNEDYWKDALSTINQTIALYQQHIGDAKRNKDSYSIRSKQLQNLKSQQAELMKKYKESNSIDYAINLLKKLKNITKNV